MTHQPTSPTTSESAPPPDALKADLSKLAATISTALKLVEKGNLVDLSALEHRTQVVCDAALALPADQSRNLLPVMKGIIAGLDALEEALTHHFGHLKTTADSNPGSSRAASLYAKTQSAG